MMRGKPRCDLEMSGKRSGRGGFQCTTQACSWEDSVK